MKEHPWRRHLATFPDLQKSIDVLTGFLDTARAWAESEEGRAFFAAHPEVNERAQLVARMATTASAWAESDEGRCFLEAGTRAVVEARATPGSRGGLSH